MSATHLRDPLTRLTSERLMLRTWQPDDAALVYEACQDDEIQRWTRVPCPYSMSDAEGFIATAPERWAAGLPSFAVLDRDGIALLGSMGFVRCPDVGVLEVGYWFTPMARGHGFASEALRTISAWAFNDPSVHRIEWTAHAGNARSRATAELCGFTFEGTLRNRTEHRGQRVDLWIAGLVRPGAWQAHVPTVEP